MKRLAIGVLAHVDAGKTTLSEALLYNGGALRRLGRVDHGDAFLDTDALERERGITIFSKMALLPLEGMEITLLDTPGHADLSAETERVLAALDAAVLVVDGAAGVQAHTRTLWALLERYETPVFLFVNKMDLAGADRAAALASIQRELSPACLALDQPLEALAEAAATLEDAALEEFLASGGLSPETLAGLVGRRKLFPTLFGSALKNQGVRELLDALRTYLPPPVWPEDFSAIVFKIARDPQGARLTYLKVTGGTLRVKDALATGPQGETEKADQLRAYSGEKYRLLDQAPAGTVCAVTGLERSFAGQALGAAGPVKPPALEAVSRREVLLPEGADVHTALRQLRTLEEEDPQLRVEWNAALERIHIRLMGQVQLEVLERVIRERFGLAVSFGEAGVVYRETIRGPVEGIGHFEPLRHYAEVHLLMEPLPRGAGLEFGSILSEDILEGHWQRLILTHLREKTHLGVLTGSPLTDTRIRLAAGAASLDHTEGGDFREATYRAVRQGLMEAESVLLEPWADFRISLPAGQIGRALSDLARMGGRVDPPEILGDWGALTGSAPMSELLGYPEELASATRGQGSVTTLFRGYEECHDTQAVLERIGYEPERDLENTPDSVFCAHGAGYPVKWNQVRERAHLESVLPAAPPADEAAQPPAGETRRKSGAYESAQAQDRELRAIFERTYGKIRRRDILPQEERRQPPPRPKSILDKDTVALKARLSGPEILLVDGYNIVFAWEDLRRLADLSVDAARQALMDLLADFRGARGCQIVLVFDAYRVPGGTGSVQEYHGVTVVFTKEGETADTYIEKAAHRLRRDKSARVFVASSDGPERLIALGAGATRMTAAELRAEVEAARLRVDEILREARRQNRGDSLRDILETEGKKGDS